MMKTANSLCPAILWLLGAAPALGQPVLEDVERNVRRQVGAPPLIASDAGAAPAAVQPGYLGVVADDRGEQGRGIRVREVLPGGPAATGGLQSADLITAIAGRTIRTMDDMIQALAPLPAGQRVEFQINRAGVAQKVTVVLGARPPQEERRFPDFGKQPENSLAPADRTTGVAASPPSGPLLGVRTVPATPDLRRRFNITVEAEGVLVSAVTVGSPAEKIGLTPGVLLTAINGQAVNHPDTVSALVHQAGPGREIELTYWAKNVQQRQRVILAGGGAAIQSPLLPQVPFNFVPDSQSSPAAAPRSDAATEALERRIQLLEQRLDKLEAALRAAAPPKE